MHDLVGNRAVQNLEDVLNVRDHHLLDPPAVRHQEVLKRRKRLLDCILQLNRERGCDAPLYQYEGLMQRETLRFVA